MKKIILNLLIILLIIINIGIIWLDYYSSKNYSYIILNKNNIWKVDNNKINKINNKNVKKLNYSKIKIYDDSETNGYINNSNYFEIYNDSYEKLNVSPTTFIVKGDIQIKNYSKKIINNISLEDQEIIKKVLKDNDFNYDVNQLFVIKFKLNNNRIAYSITPYSTGGVSEESFSLIFISDNKNYEIIYKNKETTRMSSLDKIIDINNDNKLEIILLSDVPGSAGNECYSLYEYNEKSGKYEPTIDCEGE